MQAPLFDAPAQAYGHYGEALPPFQRHSETSREAAIAIADEVTGLRGLVLAYIRTCGSAGSTDEEGITSLKMNPSTYRPRRIELNDLGYIKESGTRKTVSGRNAVVWVAK